jgi:hypothetical protein
MIANRMKRTPYVHMSRVKIKITDLAVDFLYLDWKISILCGLVKKIMISKGQKNIT